MAAFTNFTTLSVAFDGRPGMTINIIRYFTEFETFLTPTKPFKYVGGILQHRIGPKARATENLTVNFERILKISPKEMKVLRNSKIPEEPKKRVLNRYTISDFLYSNLIQKKFLI